uniref:Cyclin-dependent kinase 2-associated protein 1 n=1 Tax=Sphaerodactylus townsendi TaxID=933632 RepID=A0ACB8FZH5_9SAUR
MAGSGQYRQLINDYGPPSLGYTQSVQGTRGSQVPQSKYARTSGHHRRIRKEIRPAYAGSKSAMERLKRGIIHARGLVESVWQEPGEMQDPSLTSRVEPRLSWDDSLCLATMPCVSFVS